MKTWLLAVEGRRFFPLVLLAARVTALTVNGLSCPSFDKGGDNLEDAQFDGNWTCTYFSDVSCAYLSDGSFVASESSDANICPTELEGANLRPTLSTSTTKTLATPPPSTPSSSSSTPPSSPSIFQTQSSPGESSSASSSSSSTSSAILTSALSGSSGTPTIASSSTMLSQMPSPSGSSATILDSKATRTGAIAGSLVSIGVVAVILLVALWLKRRRQQSPPDPEQYSVARPNFLFPEGKAGATADGGSPSPPIPLESDNSTREDTGAERNIPRDETLALRVQRMEAQLRVLLTDGATERAPPSYGR
ncbi:hypothetical protein K438DRAFT_1850599 [Mycena galopus ATCC 62051]|nr:hypothetical protein K438DRAFT_1850599 [Mycena galopus ATCC 62051]